MKLPDSSIECRNKTYDPSVAKSCQTSVFYTRKTTIKQIFRESTEWCRKKAVNVKCCRISNFFLAQKESELNMKIRKTNSDVILHKKLCGVPAPDAAVCVDETEMTPAAAAADSVVQ